MNRIKLLKEQRGAKLKELEALRTGAENRAFTKDEAGKFDALENDIKNRSAEDIKNNVSVAQGLEEEQHFFLAHYPDLLEKGAAGTRCRLCRCLALGFQHCGRT